MAHQCPPFWLMSIPCRLCRNTWRGSGPPNHSRRKTQDGIVFYQVSALYVPTASVPPGWKMKGGLSPRQIKQRRGSEEKAMSKEPEVEYLQMGKGNWPSASLLFPSISLKWLSRQIAKLINSSRLEVSSLAAYSSLTSSDNPLINTP